MSPARNATAWPVLLTLLFAVKVTDRMPARHPCDLLRIFRWAQPCLQNGMETRGSLLDSLFHARAWHGERSPAQPSPAQPSPNKVTRLEGSPPG
jgi:hypothetical protein